MIAAKDRLSGRLQLTIDLLNYRTVRLTSELPLITAGDRHHIRGRVLPRSVVSARVACSAGTNVFGIDASYAWTHRTTSPFIIRFPLKVTRHGKNRSYLTFLFKKEVEEAAIGYY
jgi:hypothetical protein